MSMTFTLQFLFLDGAFTDLRDPIFEVLAVSTENALVKCIVIVILELQCVHLGTFKPMESF